MPVKWALITIATAVLLCKPADCCRPVAAGIPGTAYRRRPDNYREIELVVAIGKGRLSRWKESMNQHTGDTPPVWTRVAIVRWKCVRWDARGKLAKHVRSRAHCAHLRKSR